MKNYSTLLFVVAAALIDGSGRILLQRRRLEGEHGGLWEFPGGKIEVGESPEFTILREIEEELGIRMAPESLRAATFASGPRASRDDENGLVILLYTCRSWSGEARCLDGEEISWFRLEDMPGLEMPPLDVPLARALSMMLANNCV